MHAVSTKSGRGLSESSSSDGGEEVLAYKAQWAKETDLRELLNKANQLLEIEGTKPTVQSEK